MSVHIECDLYIGELRTQLAAALKERDEARVQLKAAETLLELAASTHAGVAKERDEARAKLHTVLEQRDQAGDALEEEHAALSAATVLIDALTQERDRVAAALEPTAENLNAYGAALGITGTLASVVVDFLAVISARAGLEVSPLSCQHGRPGGHLCPHRAGLEQLDRVPGDHGQGHEQPAGEHAVADGLRLAVGGDGVDDQAHDADDERDEGDHPPSVRGGGGGGKEG